MQLWHQIKADTGTHQVYGGFLNDIAECDGRADPSEGDAGDLDDR